jgi:2-phosphoglycerate kinase
MDNNRVFLIGGAPGAGKTTLGIALANCVGGKSLTIDDLVSAAIAVTTPETHPGLHVMRKIPYLEYYTYSSLDQLKEDATLRHEASWPMVESIIQKYVKGKSTIVIDGWHLRPNMVSKLKLKNVWSGWIVIDPKILEKRERTNVAWLQGSPDPEQMLENYLARSLWYNNLIKEQASKHKMNILFQDGTTSVDELCKWILEKPAGQHQVH